MNQLALLSAPVPRAVAGVDLRCCDVAEVLAEVRGARLIHADPPWVYSNSGCGGNAADEYDLLDLPAIVRHVDATFDAAADGARLVLWTTWPKVGEWFAATLGPGASWRWGAPTTGGSWHKEGAPGVGFHWLGNSEPVLLYVKGSPSTDRGASVRNAHDGGFTHNSFREAHSEKPTAWLRGMLERWTVPGDLVLDIYAGMAPMARACALEGRRYVGAEIDPTRHRMALDRLAMALSRGAA